MVHDNSLLAYIEEKESNKIGNRQLEVLNYLKLVKTSGATAREIMIELGYTDLNSVRPRLTELKKYGFIYEKERKKDFITGKTVCVFSVK